MSLIANIKFVIGGQALPDVMSVRLYQSFQAPHSFETICRFDAIEGENGFFPDKSNKFLGASCEIQINNVQIFKGIVTELEGMINASQGEKFISIRGRSPEIVADNVEDCRSFEQKSLKEIIDDVLNPYSSYLNKLNNKPAEGEKPHSYIVQYNETPYDFIRRLCSKYGEWFFYNGLEFYVGKPRKELVQLKYSIDLHSFTAKSYLIPVKFEAMSYDYVEGKVIDKTSSDKDKSQSQLSPYGKNAYDASAKVFKTANVMYYNQPLAEKGGKEHLDTRVALRKGGMIGNLVTYTGISENPNIKVGDLISISGMEYLHLDNTYLITEVNHYCERNGNYQNDFTAIDAKIQCPPVTNPLQHPFCETQSAVVKDNADPEKLNRVRVQFPWQVRYNELTPWIRVQYPHAGKEKGICFIPEIDEEVHVSFEDNNAEKPIVQGSLFHGKAKPDEKLYSDTNDSKIIRTRSGHTIEFYDKDGKEEIRIYDKGAKNTITFKSHEKSLTIWSEKEIFIEAQKIHINAKDELNLNGDNKVTETTNKTMVHKSGSKITMEGTEIGVKGSSKIQLKGGQIKMN